MIDINKLQEITEKLNRSKLLKGMAYDVLNTFIEQQKEQLNLHDVVVSDADIYLASADEKVDLVDARGFRQGAKWCRRQY